MRLALLSNGYFSDSIQDAGPIRTPAPAPRDAGHFAALCRGVAVLVILSVTFGLTALEAGSTRHMPGAAQVADAQLR